jgi:voltage-gated potassium channel Kch
MAIVTGLLAVVLILLLLVDALETTVLPRRVTHRFRLARFYYRTVWQLWRAIGMRIQKRNRRESFLSYFGPLSLLGLLAVWVVGLIFAFALLHWSLHTSVQRPDKELSFSTYMYWSGGTFFTLGYGDIVPDAMPGRMIAVLESGIGFGFLALIISYLPVINQAYSRREALVALLDARAGSPPSAAQMLVRIRPTESEGIPLEQSMSEHVAALNSFLAEWERWSADLLESLLSFPVLSYYRSQHDNQSWLASLTTVLDTCAVFMAGVKDVSQLQAQLTFAMARHAAVDIALIFKIPPRAPEVDRMPIGRLMHLHRDLQIAGFQLHDIDKFEKKVAELRDLYEPFVSVLSERFLFELPEIAPDRVTPDNWQRSSWKKRAPTMENLPAEASIDGHFK